MDERYLGSDNINNRVNNVFTETPHRFGNFSDSTESSRGRLGRLFGDKDCIQQKAGISRDRPYTSQSKGSNTNGYGMQASGGGVIIYSPTTYEDVQLLIDHLKIREQVIVDFSNINQTSVYRILDFMSGAIYALGGSIQQINKNIFLFAPSGVTITIPPQINKK